METNTPGETPNSPAPEITEVKNETAPAAEVAPAPLAPTNEIILSDGRKALILSGKGRHAQEAMDQSEGKSKLYMATLMAQLVTIDGKEIVPEDLAELGMQDYNKIFAKFASVNF